ncbi:hypothetical protein [Sphingobium sp. TomTYG45]
MPESLFTFRHAAEIFCKVDGRSDADVSAVYLQVKGLYDRGLLNVAAERAARGANQIEFKELCRARLLLILLDLGIESENLQRANARLDTSTGRTPLEGGPMVRYNLEAAMASKTPWVLAMNLSRLGGKPSFSVMLLPAAIAALPMNEYYDGPHGGGDPTHPESQVKFADPHLAYLKIPASKLFNELRSAVDA